MQIRKGKSLGKLPGLFERRGDNMIIKEYGLRIDQEKNQYYLEVIQSLRYENMELNSPEIICDLI